MTVRSFSQILVLINLHKIKSQKLTETFFCLNTENEPETYSNVALMLLAYVINISPARKIKGKPAWKPSRAEVCDGYISQADATNKIIEKKENLQRLGRTVQPYVIFVGPNVIEVKVAYVVINDTLYSFNKLVTAVDCAFKIFQSTGACYPE